MILFLFAGVFMQGRAQDPGKEKIKALLDGKHYEFEPTNTTTGGGRLKQLTPGYVLEMRGDTLKVYLPYFGKAYTAPINSSDAGYDFTSTDFSYEVSEGKKDSYIVSIKTKDRSYNADFELTVYDNASAYLRASSTYKQSVSYNGDVKAKE
jgi:Domain of unknown function (DUF4251)